MINKIDKLIDKLIQSIENNPVKLLCFLIMPITWFVSWFFCNALLASCIKVLRFIMQVEIFTLSVDFTDFFIAFFMFMPFYPLCIICYYAISILFYIFSILEKKITRKQYSLIKKIHFLHFCIFIIIVVMSFFGFVFGYDNIIDRPTDLPDEEMYYILISLVMGIIAYMKVYCIDKSKYKTFTIISIGEIVGIPAIFEIEKLIKHLL